MKQEKEEILQRFHEMEMQLHQAQEALTKNILEEELDSTTILFRSFVNCFWKICEFELIEVLFFIAIKMTTSSSEVSKSSSFTRFFDEDMKRDFYILKAMVQIMF